MGKAETLRDRIDEAMSRVGKMCSEGRPPRMSIPVRPDDDDTFICDTLRACRTALADSADAPEGGIKFFESSSEIARKLPCGCWVIHGLGELYCDRHTADAPEGAELKKHYIVFRCDVDNSTVVAVRDLARGADVYVGVAETPDVQTAGVVLEALRAREESKKV